MGQYRGAEPTWLAEADKRWGREPVRRHIRLYGMVRSSLPGEHAEWKVLPSFVVTQGLLLLAALAAMTRKNREKSERLCKELLWHSTTSFSFLAESLTYPVCVPLRAA